MSKSYGNAIALREDKDSVAKKVRTMPTDPARVRRTDAGDPARARSGSCTKCIPTPTQDWVVKGCTRPASAASNASSR
jgi:tryptophanyl-tRNA synthetase